jgi:starvation-inducible DNA-binding protein
VSGAHKIGGEIMPSNTASKTARQHSATARTNGKIKSYPAPKQLATPTDLLPEEVEQIVAAVNPLIADAFALFTKTKNFHWHVASSHYRDYHLLLDEQAASIFESIDTLAERVRRIGGTTIRSISHIGQLQTIEDDNRDFVTPDKMIEELLKDNLHIAEMQRAAIETCDQNRDTPTGNLLQEILDQTERRIWFLYEISTGGKNEY